MPNTHLLAGESREGEQETSGWWHHWEGRRLPTLWVSHTVTPPKRDFGATRLCVDMHKANKVIQRGRHPTPTVNELITDLNGARFSKLDLRTGYHQLELKPDHRYITTFSTHMSLYKMAYTLLLKYTRRLSSVIQDIPGTKTLPMTSSAKCRQTMILLWGPHSRGLRKRDWH